VESLKEQLQQALSQQQPAASAGAGVDNADSQEDQRAIIQALREEIARREAEFETLNRTCEELTAAAAAAETKYQDLWNTQVLCVCACVCLCVPAGRNCAYLTCSDRCCASATVGRALAGW